MAVSENFVGMTGQGATVTLSVTGDLGCVKAIQLPEWTQNKIDASCLNTSGYKKYIPSDLSEPGEVTFTVVYEGVSPLVGLSVNDSDVKAAETLTITIPDPESSVQGAILTTLAGTGFISSVQHPNMEVDGLLEMTVTFCFDGGATPPAWTVAGA